MTKTSTIYALSDPRDKTPHYVGKTVQNPPQKRLQQHLMKPATQALAQWFDELQELGLKPDLQVLEEVPPDADWRAAEIYWIRHGLAHNWPLKNAASGGDNYPLDLILSGKANDIIPRVIYGSEDTFRLLTSINAYVMKGKKAEDNRFRDLFHRGLSIHAAEATDEFDTLKHEFRNTILSHGIIQMGRGWRVPVIKKRNLLGEEFLTVGKPFTINGIALPGNWNHTGWRTTIKMYKQTSELLDTLATELQANQRRGYDNVLQQALDLLATIFDEIVAM